MKKIVLILLFIIGILIGNVGTLKQNVQAVNDQSMTLGIKTDTTDLKSKNKLYINISILEFKNIDNLKPLAISANINYNDTLLSKPTIKGKDGWSAIINNKKIILDCASFSDNKTIAVITLDVINSISISTSINIELTNVEISDGDKYYEKIEKIESNSINFFTSSNNENNNEQINENNNSDKNEVTNETRNLSNNNNSTDETDETNNEINKQENNETKNDNLETATIQKVDKIEPIKDATTSNKPIPQTGASISVLAIIIMILIIGIYTFIRDKKFYD